ncbi:hypothetical protein N0V88_002817 [Collariella sp. IMI 366227]|nr:hypothetical protein N0V88_002817 [Collariella sp. IMI 366227]
MIKEISGSEERLKFVNSHWETALSEIKSPYPPPLLDRRVRGVVDHLSINAVPDTGADESFISANLLKRLKYHNRHRPSNLGTEIQQYEFDHLPPVQLASGKTVCSTTIATIPWRFEGESRIDWLTLTTFKHRVVTTVRSVAGGGLRMVRMLNYMGQNKRRLWGYLDGALVTALPDSGSDIVAISAEYARQRGFGFDMSPGKQVLVQFADGSMARTDGVVEGLKWVFGAGGQSVISDFYVLRDLPVDVLFSSDFVFDHDVFRRHKWSFYRDENSLDMLLCNIRLMSQRRFKRNPSNKENEEDLFDGKV